MGSDKLLQTFLNDSQTFIERLNALILQLEREPENIDLMEQAFRWAHSLKSESSYMDYDGLTQTAHSLETELELLRTGEIKVNADSLDRMFALLDKWQLQMGDLQAKEVEIPLEINISTEASDSSWDLNDFEYSLLEESQKRGELFYRIICDLEEDTPLKFAKAYLIINNLELIVNVVKISPSMNELKDGDYANFSILFSSSVGEGEINRAVNVDQVKQIHLSLLRYGSFGTPGNVKSAPIEIVETEDLQNAEPIEEAPYQPPVTSQGPLKVSTTKVDQLLNYMDEMRLRLHQFEDQVPDGESKEKEMGEWNKMRSLMGGMEEALKEMRMVPLADSLGGLPRLVRDLCHRAGKSGRLEVSGGDIRTDKRIVELLAEPLTHLIRNAVDHGLENAELRAESSKSAEGLIELNITQTDDELIILLTDDGAGIKRQEVLAEAASRGILGEEEKDTLHYLLQPGFTTRKTASPLSGRGLGLDLIARTIRQEAGGTLSMNTQEGQGTSFILQIPRGYQPTVLLLFKSGGEIYGLPKRGDTDVAESLDEKLWDRRDDGLFWNNLPVFSPQGRFIPGTNLPSGKVGIILSHLGQEACILADDILFEQEITEDQMTMGREVSPHVYEYYQNGEKKEFLYLDPSFLV